LAETSDNRILLGLGLSDGMMVSSRAATVLEDDYNWDHDSESRHAGAMELRTSANITYHQQLAPD
jgi:hypothetical protein